jgi:hypothetical protein
LILGEARGLPELDVVCRILSEHARLLVIGFDSLLICGKHLRAAFAALPVSSLKLSQIPVALAGQSRWSGPNKARPCREYQKTTYSPMNSEKNGTSEKARFQVHRTPVGQHAVLRSGAIERDYESEINSWEQRL